MASGKTALIASGNPFRPSTTAIRMSATVGHVAHVVENRRRAPVGAELVDGAPVRGDHATVRDSGGERDARARADARHPRGPVRARTDPLQQDRVGRGAPRADATGDEQDVDLRRVREAVVGEDSQAVDAADRPIALGANQEDVEHVRPKGPSGAEDLVGADGVELLDVVEHEDAYGGLHRLDPIVTRVARWWARRLSVAGFARSSRSGSISSSSITSGPARDGTRSTLP